NDTLGHDAGDTLLIEAARRVSSCLRGTSTVARLGGDEFLVILPGLTGSDAACQVAERILQTFSTPFMLNAQEVFVTTSIGIATFPNDADNSGTLLQHADAAMYEALQLNEFQLCFQPIVDTTTGRLVAAEALLRWQNPALGLVMPDRFIPLAEETGMIIPIGEWVIQEACKAARCWQALAGYDIGIAVNVSPRQFRDPGFTDVVMRALNASNLKPELLELEITERLI